MNPITKKRKLDSSLIDDSSLPSPSSSSSTATPAPASPSSTSQEETLSKSEKGKLKKKKKEEQKALSNPPSFSFDTRGFKGGRHIQTKDVRDFVLHLLNEEKAQQWLFVANKRNLKRVLVLMIPGITPSLLGLPTPLLSANLPFSLIPPPSPPSTSTSTSEQEPPLEPTQLPIFQTLFSHACPTKAPGEKNRMHSTYQHFVNVDVTGAEKDRREKARKEKGQSAKTLDPTVYLLTPLQMEENAYPSPSPIPTPSPPASAAPLKQKEALTFEDWQKLEGWIEAPFYEGFQQVEESLKGKEREVFGVDCEMCLTEDGSELTRISVVNTKGVRIYDTLVKPSKPILDYLTKFSGITPEKLSGVTTTILDVQKHLSTLFSIHTVLVGHSLESDLKVLRLIHSKVVDTSVLYQHPRGPPFKASLKWLAQKWLKKEIQNHLVVLNGSDTTGGGHDSEEDATTAVELLLLKMEKGPGFGEFITDQESIFERIARGNDPKTSAVVDHGTPGQWHGAKAKTTIACSTDDEVLKGLMESIPNHDFTFGRFMELSHALGWSQPTHSSSLPPGATVPTSSTLPLSTVLINLNTHLSTLHSSLPPSTALIILSPHSDPREMVRLSAKKAKFDKLWKQLSPSKLGEIEDEDRWLESDDRKLVDEVERARAGWGFYCIK